jgi:putative sporulation protein YyaC
MNNTMDKLKLHIDKPEFVESSATFLIQKIKEIDPTNKRPLVTFCIGTDRSTGDCLGPLVGYLLQKKQPYNDLVCGTIDKPVHAINIEETLAQVHKSYNNPIIIAVDACLGKLESIGYVNIFSGSLKPGSAVNKDLPAVGDLSVSGIVNVGGFMEYLVLQNTRLSFVMQMAEKVSDTLAKVYNRTMKSVSEGIKVNT